MKYHYVTAMTHDRNEINLQGSIKHGLPRGVLLYRADDIAYLQATGEFLKAIIDRFDGIPKPSEIGFNHGFVWYGDFAKTIFRNIVDTLIDHNGEQYIFNDAHDRTYKKY